MTANHAHFEVLCALAASGQLTSVELAELHEHSESCSACEDRLVEMTRVSAELLCGHAAGQSDWSGRRMQKEMLVRFIARANYEGIPLNPRIAIPALGRHALAAAFVFVLLMGSLTYHFGSRSRTADEMLRGDTGSMSASMSEKRSAAPVMPANFARSDTRAGIGASRRKARGNGRMIPFLSTRADGYRWGSRLDSADLRKSQFDVTVEPRTFATFHLPLLVAAKPGQDIEWAPARYGTPRFSFVEASEYGKDDPPQLLAGYEPRFTLWTNRDRFAFESADLQALRRDFNPDARTKLFSPDFKQNLPAFQFSDDAAQ